MSAGNAKAIKGKIKSVKNTKQITKAMEMISAVKMRKAIAAAKKSRDYAELAHNLVQNIATSVVDIESNLLKSGDSQKDLLIIIASNKGLCGNYNNSVFLAAQTHIENTTSTDIVAVGKKSVNFAKRRGENLVAVYSDLPEYIHKSDVQSIIDMSLSEFETDKYKSVSLVYTKFVSSLVRQVKVEQVLPLNLDDVRKVSEFGSFGNNDNKNTRRSKLYDYKFEPNARQILDYLLKKSLEAKILQAFLESKASEHSSRMVAMKNATEAAGDMIDDLILEYNKSRQASITQEIAEISNAAAAMN